MTRKDFELIAAALADARRLILSQERCGAAKAHDLAALCVAQALATTNPRFDQRRFLIAAGPMDDLSN